MEGADLGADVEANMRRLILAGLLCLFGLLTSELARAEIWCLRSFDNGSGACVFPSLQDCVRAAAVGAFGGRCERQGFTPSVTTDKRRTDRKRHARRRDHAVHAPTGKRAAISGGWRANVSQGNSADQTFPSCEIRGVQDGSGALPSSDSFSRWRNTVRGSTPRSRAVLVRLPLLSASTSLM